MSDDKKPSGKSPGGSPGKAPPGKPSPSKAAAGKAPTGKTPAGKTPAGKTPAGKTPGGHSSGRKTPAKKKDDRFAENLKTAYKRSLSSQLWLRRQLNDPYVQRAKQEGWRSRAAFKLIEIDQKHRFLKPGQTIVDLGCAPGGWCQYAAQRAGSGGAGKGCVVGIDILPVEPIPGVTLAEMDFTDEDAPERLRALVGEAGGTAQVDGVLSDMAANTTGHRQTDHLKIIGLTEMAVEFACEILKPGGFFLTKLFQGGESAVIIGRLKRDFAVVRHVKPQASRADSAELYVLATGFRGG